MIWTNEIVFQKIVFHMRNLSDIYICYLQPEFSRLRRFFYSAKILDGDASISYITVSDGFIESE
jgi:hypothetical protein